MANSYLKLFILFVLIIIFILSNVHRNKVVTLKHFESKLRIIIKI